MREIFKYGSVRGLRLRVVYDGDRSTRHNWHAIQDKLLCQAEMNQAPK